MGPKTLFQLLGPYIGGVEFGGGAGFRIRKSGLRFFGLGFRVYVSPQEPTFFKDLHKETIMRIPKDPF